MQHCKKMEVLVHGGADLSLLVGTVGPLKLRAENVHIYHKH